MIRYFPIECRRGNICSKNETDRVDSLYMERQKDQPTGADDTFRARSKNSLEKQI